MNTTPQQLLEFALSLPESDRADIAATLIQSLESKVDVDCDAEWTREIKRRIQLLDDGQAKMIESGAVFQEMRERRTS